MACFVDRIFKRSFDITVSATALVILAPAFAWIGWKIRRDTPGPTFYVQERSGYRGPFRMYKFRTMTRDADDRLATLMHLNMHSDPRLYKLTNDPRITRFGHFLRRYSIDELPQLLNVLIGNMSLVGPRPLSLMEDQHVVGDMRSRITVRPGITGPWQVSGGNNLPFEEMMRLDCQYAAGWSFCTDFYWLFRTLPTIWHNTNSSHQ